ncbi:hypothetical protein A0H81_14508 [Grifola frondosa]|uniref:DUF6534 domain-containing protein n=1 Tax=Grifola frondosa TaxID=5627 RepID=A0A1C7LMV8_GRIFR|nr:hypothetical protein A0H81_14508 [Grifola frondosa]
MSAAFEAAFGGFLVTTFIATALYGVTIVQVYVYLRNYPKDSVYLRMLVLAIWLAETVHTAFCIHQQYNYLIIDFDNPVALVSNVWSLTAALLIEVIVANTVQGFFIHRIWILNGRSVNIMLAPATILLVLEYVFQRAATVVLLLMFGSGNLSEYRKDAGSIIVTICALCVAAVNDFLVTLVLIRSLYRRRSGVPETDDLIRVLMVYIVNTGLIPMLNSLAILFTFVFFSNSLVYVGLLWIECKLYANSFLATLNARKSLRGHKPHVALYDSNSLELSRRQPPAQHIEIFPKTSRVTVHDGAPDAASSASIKVNQIVGPSNSAGGELSTRKAALLV